MADDVRSEARPTEHWRAWEGSASSVARLCAEVDRLAEPLRQKAIRDAENLWKVDPPSEYSLAKQQKAIDEAQAKWRVKVIASEPVFRTEHSGTPAAVLGQIEGLTLASLTVTMPEGAYVAPRIVARFDRGRGCDLLVEGEPQWVRATFSTLRDSIKRDLPWWRFMRSYAAAYVLAVLVGLPPYIAFLGQGEEAHALYGALGGMVVGFLAIPFNIALTWLLPGFDIRPEGAKGRGGRLLATVGALVLGIIGSMIATLILSD